MGVLVLKLAGPLQSWGSGSRFVERKTRHEPTKSGIVGILAAALGRRREDPIDDIASLRMAVRVDQPGRFERDFQTAHTRVFNKATNRWEASGKSLPLSRRYYVADAVYIAVVEIPANRIVEFAEALQHPVFPLYLGRRSCSPSARILLDSYVDKSLEAALSDIPWQANNVRLISGQKSSERVSCDVLMDAVTEEESDHSFDYVQDVPLSFSSEHREYEWRRVMRTSVQVPNPYFEKSLADEPHDPMALFEEM